jgi:perosamine synthetase
MEIFPQKIIFTKDQREWIIENIDSVLKSGKLSQGKYVEEFEKQFARAVNMRNAVAVNSGTSAIEIVMRILNVSGKDVLVPTNTFIATASGVLFAGGNIRLVDTDPATFSVSLKELKRRVSGKTAGVIIVHIGGIITPEIEAIREWCDDQGFWLFEDAAHAHGCHLNGRYAGSFGIAGSYSFFATKVITSGEGGFVVTNDDELANKVKLIRNHGKPKPWESYNTELGSNWRMQEVSAIIGLSRLEQLAAFKLERTHIASLYTQLIKEKLPRLTPILPLNESSYYKYIVLLPDGVKRDEVKSLMKEKSVYLAGEVYNVPLHKQPALSDLQDTSSFPVADDLCERHICLPIYPGLTDTEVAYTVEMLAEVIEKIKQDI